jgi:hypothetical protein
MRMRHCVENMRNRRGDNPFFSEINSCNISDEQSRNNKLASLFFNLAVICAVQIPIVNEEISLRLHSNMQKLTNARHCKPDKCGTDKIIIITRSLTHRMALVRKSHGFLGQAR